MSSERDASINELKLLSAENIILLETAFWTFDCDFNLLLNGYSYRSYTYTFKHMADVLFFFEAETKTESSITIHFCRYHLSDLNPPDSGYYINVSMSMVGCTSPPVVKCMEWDINDVSVTYDVASLNSELTNTELFTIKCTTKMVEIMSVINQNRIEQEKLLNDYVLSSEGSVAHMASLLEREELGDIFSGRQNHEFAIFTISLIVKALKYAEDIATVQRMRREGIQDSALQLPLILGYIQHGELRAIHKSECLWLYMVGHSQGLVFLQTECSEFMLSNLDNDYVIHCLLLAIAADDNYLLDKALDYFVTNREAIMASPLWEETTHKYWQTVLCIMNAMVFKTSNDGAEQASG